MRVDVADRRRFFELCYRSLKGHPTAAIVMAIFELYEFGVTYGPLVELPTTNLPKIPLPWAVITLLAFLFFLAIEGGYRLREKEKADAQTELQKERELAAQELRSQRELSERELDKERERAALSGPSITMHFKYDFKNQGHIILEHPMHEAAIVLRNDGDSTAMDVQVETIHNGNFEASFQIVSSLEPNARFPAIADVVEDGKPRPLLRHYLPPLLRAGYKDSSIDELFSSAEIPIAVSYKNMNGQRYETRGLIRYHYYHQTTDIVNQERKVIRQSP